MPPLTISEAARRCGVARRTLQRAIQAGRLALTPDHQLTVEALQQAGYVAATETHMTPQRRMVATPHVTPQVMPLLVDRLDRIDGHFTTLIQQIETLSRILTPQGEPQRHTAATPHADVAVVSQPLPQPSAAATPQTRAAARGAMRRRILALLQDHPEGLSPAELRSGLQVDKDLNNTCFAMARDGLLRRVGRGRYAGVSLASLREPSA